MKINTTPTLDEARSFYAEQKRGDALGEWAEREQDRAEKAEARAKAAENLLEEIIKCYANRCEGLMELMFRADQLLTLSEISLTKK
jgi:hypothetical protein